MDLPVRTSASRGHLEGPLPDGSEARVQSEYKPGDRREHEYLVIVVKPDGHKLGACLVGEDGVPKKWFDMPYDREAVTRAMEDLPATLAAHLVHKL